MDGLERPVGHAGRESHWILGLLTWTVSDLLQTEGGDMRRVDDHEMSHPFLMVLGVSELWPDSSADHLSNLVE